MAPDEVEAFTEGLTPLLRGLEDVVEGRLQPWPEGDGAKDGPRRWNSFSVHASGRAFDFGGLRTGGLEADRLFEAFQGRVEAAGRDGFDGAKLLGVASVSAYAKVVRVKPRASGRVVDARIRLEIGGVTREGVRVQAVLGIQATALRGEDEAPREVALECDEIEIVRGPEGAPAFVEKTAGLLAGDADAAAVLGIGMDRWAQRLDDPGMTAFFGHQGLAAGDVTGDGLPDLYVAMPAGIPNMLLVQQPDGTARDMARDLGVAWLDDTKGVLIQDLDGDGEAEIVSALGHVIVVQVPAVKGEARTFRVAGWGAAPDEAPFYSIAASDVDGDGMAELFGTRYMATRYADTVPVPFDEARNGPGNCLFRFDGRRFVDVTEAFGLRESDGGRFSLACQFVDVDQDGDEDLYVVNDFGSNRLWRLDEGRFVDATDGLGLADRGAGMGASWGDVDGDGHLDVYVTNMFSSAGQRVALQASYAPELEAERRAGARQLTRGSSLLRRGEDGRYRRDPGAGVSMGRWGWGGIFAELNGDGRLDIVAPAGFLTGPKPGDL